ncbi:MAG: ABC transporter ATP-binding protein, partial [Acidimicrobiia bacterium]|nr:ABC transporter ATP-binding protein [Acidimicrobiia bacterium]
MTESTDAVRLSGIWKRFPGVVANAGASLVVGTGSIHAVLGENGAGKTTLMNVLAGVYRADEGEVWVNGAARVFNSPADAIAAGVGMVHQEFRLVQTFTVAENVVLGAAPRVLDRGRLETEVAELAERFGLRADPSRPIWQLSMGERQRVEILKALWRDARVLILDEPTAVLTPAEADELGRIIAQMAADGRSVIFISHKLDEVKAFCDEATVLRGGATVAQSLSVADIDPTRMAELMMGDASATEAERPPPQEPGDEILAVEGLTVLSDRGLPAVDDVSVSVRAGEIVGIAGVSGNGQRELADAIAGMRMAAAGTVTVAGRDLTAAPPKRRFAKGLAYVPEDRLGVGLAPALSVIDNAVMRQYRDLSSGPVLLFDRCREFAHSLIERFNVKVGDEDAHVGTLSGGNLQRLLLGRELTGQPSVVVAAQPTRGLDVQGVRAIQQQLVDQRAAGVGVLLISEDLEELLTLS